MLPLGIRTYFLEYLSTSQIFAQCVGFESRSSEINSTFFFFFPVSHSVFSSGDLKWFLSCSLQKHKKVMLWVFLEFFVLLCFLCGEMFIFLRLQLHCCTVLLVP